MRIHVYTCLSIIGFIFHFLWLFLNYFISVTAYLFERDIHLWASEWGRRYQGIGECGWLSEFCFVFIPLVYSGCDGGTWWRMLLALTYISTQEWGIVI